MTVTLKTLILSSLLAGCAQGVNPDAPSTSQESLRRSIRDRIAAYEASNGTGKQGDIIRFYVDGSPNYLFTSGCCDMFNYAYKQEGQLICAPSGGFTGQGDGKCSESLLASLGMRSRNR